ncbi:hypothetical protein BH20ACT4_BH20ACT4_04390 [soil metagenome]
MKPGSLPDGVPKSTWTTSPARIVGDGVNAYVDPRSFGIVDAGCGERHSHPTLSLGADKSPKLLVESDSVVVGESADLVASAPRYRRAGE